MMLWWYLGCLRINACIHSVISLCVLETTLLHRQRLTLTMLDGAVFWTNEFIMEVVKPNFWNENPIKGYLLFLFQYSFFFTTVHDTKMSENLTSCRKCHSYSVYVILMWQAVYQLIYINLLLWFEISKTELLSFRVILEDPTKWISIFAERKINMQFMFVISPLDIIFEIYKWIMTSLRYRNKYVSIPVIIILLLKWKKNDFASKQS